MALSPGLMIAVKFSTSSMPMLEIVKVLPLISSGASLPLRAFSASSFARAFTSVMVSSSALRITGTTRPCSRETATPRCTWLFQRVVLPSVDAVHRGKLLQRQHHRLRDEVGDRVRRALLLELGAELHEIGHIHLDRDEEMRGA